MKFILPLLLPLVSCAQLYKVNLGEIDNRKKLVPFDVMVSETGVNLNDLKSTTRFFAQNKTQIKQVNEFYEILSLFQWGPRTGNPVFVENYADNIRDGIYLKCPSGKVTGLLSVREATKYPIVSGEIVRVSGYCIQE